MRKKNKLDIWSWYKEETRFFDWLAKTCFVLPTKLVFWEKPLWSYIFSCLGDIKGKRVLDMGCGFGRESVIFAKKEALVIAVDLSKNSIKRARNLAMARGVKDNIEFKVGNCDFLAAHKQSFDVIFCRAFLHHLPLPENTLKECYNCLKKGGILIAQEPRRENPLAIVSRKLKLYPSTKTERPFRRGELLSLFKKVFKKVDSQYFYILSPLCFIFRRVGLLRNDKLAYYTFIILNKIDKRLAPRLGKSLAWIEVIYARK